MADFKWSKNQEAAIDANDNNFLISAGAGRGKTAVLTERIFKLVKQGTPISKFLVLTFTNAAAASMKTKIRKRLLSDPDLEHLAVEIENSNIETFDAFCLFLVRKYSFEIGVNRDIAPIDNSILDIKKHKFLDDILNELYEVKDDDFIKIINDYCTKDDNIIKEIILKISNTADLQIDKEDFYKGFINKYFNADFLSSLVEKEFKKNLKTLDKIIKLAYKLEDSDDADAIEAFIESLKDSKDYDELYFKLKDKENYSFPKKNAKVKTGDKDYRDYIRKMFVSLVPTDKSDFGTKHEIISSYLSNQKVV